jgi:signal peptidase I
MATSLPASTTVDRSRDLLPAWGAALPGAADPWAEPRALVRAGAGSRPRRRSRVLSGSARFAAAGGGEAAATRHSEPRWPGKVMRRLLWGLPTLLVLIVLAALSLPVLFGCRSLVVMSGSMEPSIPTGAVVVVKRIPASALEVGDVVSFRSSEEGGRVLTHRVQRVEMQEGRVAVETRGDANTGSESWVIDPQGVVGRVVFHLPLAGYALAPLQGLLPRLLLVVVPALALAVLLLVDIWHPERARRAPARPVRSEA